MLITPQFKIFLIEETNGGLISNPEDYNSIEKNINWFIENADSEELENMGKRSREYLIQNITKDISINKYKEEIFAEMSVVNPLEKSFTRDEAFISVYNAPIYKTLIVESSNEYFKDIIIVNNRDIII